MAKKKPHAHIRLEVNGRVFDESGDPAEVKKKLDAFIDSIFRPLEQAILKASQS